MTPGPGGDGAAAQPSGLARVRCDDCGPQLIPLAGVRLLSFSAAASYTFTCAGCGKRVRRPADAALRRVLREAGAVGLALVADGAEDGSPVPAPPPGESAGSREAADPER